MSHTPGKWIDASEDGCISAIHEDGTETGICAVLSGPDAEDNAALILAAPEMLEILKGMDSSGYDIDTKKVARIRDLIKRAEGETK